MQQSDTVKANSKLAPEENHGEPEEEFTVRDESFANKNRTTL